MDQFLYQKTVPMTKSYDVVFCGGAPAGIGDAVAAAESGARTVLIERFSTAISHPLRRLSASGKAAASKAFMY